MCPIVVVHSTEAFAAVSYLQFSVELVDKGLPSGLSQLQLLCSGQSPFQYPLFLSWPKKIVVFKSSKSTWNSVDTTRTELRYIDPKFLQSGWRFFWNSLLTSVYFFGGLECVLATPLLMSHILILRDVWIRIQRAVVASRRATNLATQLPEVLVI